METPTRSSVWRRKAASGSSSRSRMGRRCPSRITAPPRRSTRSATRRSAPPSLLLSSGGRLLRDSRDRRQNEQAAEHRVSKRRGHHPLDSRDSSPSPCGSPWEPRFRGSRPTCAYGAGFSLRLPLVATDAGLRSDRCRDPGTGHRRERDGLHHRERRHAPSAAVRPCGGHRTGQATNAGRQQRQLSDARLPRASRAARRASGARHSRCLQRRPIQPDRRRYRGACDRTPRQRAILCRARPHGSPRPPVHRRR